MLPSLAFQLQHGIFAVIDLGFNWFCSNLESGHLGDGTGINVRVDAVVGAGVDPTVG